MRTAFWGEFFLRTILQKGTHDFLKLSQMTSSVLLSRLDDVTLDMSKRADMIITVTTEEAI